MRSAIVLFLMLCGVGTAHAQSTSFSLPGLTAAPGSTASTMLRVEPAGGDGGAEIPVTVIQGSRRGPVLALFAGVHGQEYTPILALQRVRAAIDPQTLSGTLILVHVANMPSFAGRTIYYSPADRKNLNRVFPGKPDGTLSERIAYRLTRDIIEKATHVVDIHSGDGNESLRPYLYWMINGTQEVIDRSREMALASGFDHVVVDRGRPKDPNASLYLSNTAILRGKPALTVESGFLATSDEASILRIERAVAGWLKLLGMRAEGPAPIAAEQVVWMERSQVLTSGHTGIFYPAVERGHSVAQGALIGRITDFFGKVLQEVRAPFAGEILYVIGTPAMNAGEPVAFIGAAK